MTENTIILCAGSVHYLDLPSITSFSKAMIPINGKPAIGWILDDLIEKGIITVTVVMEKKDQNLQRYLKSVYAHRLTLLCKPLDRSRSINNSLSEGLDTIRDPELVRVILGDTLIKDSYHYKGDFAYASRVETSSKWCVIKTNGKTITEYIDKPKREIKNPYVLSGYYHFLHGEWLIQCVADAVKKKSHELSDVLIQYGESYPIAARSAKSWIDFGHSDSLVSARQTLLKSRFFNSLKIDPLYNTITKTSTHNDKLKDELNWYLSVPDKLKAFSPRLFASSSINEKKISITQEYYGYPTLAELYVYSDLRKDMWSSILNHLFKVHGEFKKYRGRLDAKYVAAMYIRKTHERLAAWADQDPRWKKILASDTITINGKAVNNLNGLRKFIDRQSKRMVATASRISVIHGDYCLSNMLFDINNQIIRLIDPRGSFGRRGVYGDPRYDIAKLRHSVCSFYDFIVADMFSLTHDKNFTSFHFTIFRGDTQNEIAQQFDLALKEKGYKLEDIKFIEALLFLSMLPLHRDKPQRQQIFYLTGISLLNSIIDR